MMRVALGEEKNAVEAVTGLLGKVRQYKPRPEWHDYYRELMVPYRKLAEGMPELYSGWPRDLNEV